MRILRVTLSALLLMQGTSAFGGTIPEAVHKASENVYAICDVLDVTSKWSDSNGAVETRSIPGIECGVGFQVSPTEIVTSAHVVHHPVSRLVAPESGYLFKQFSAYAHHGFYFEPNMPIGVMDVSFHREFIGTEGQVFTTPTLHFQANFDGDPTKMESLQEFARVLIEKTTIEVDETKALVTHTFDDSGRDLALFTLKYPVLHEAYVEVDMTGYEVHTMTWGLHTRKPGQFDNGLPQVHIGSGVVKATEVIPEVSYWPLDPQVFTYNVMTENLNVRGYSGSPNVNQNGKLVGVTHAAPEAETTMSNFDVQLPCNQPKEDGSYFPCHQWIIPGHIVHEFLKEARGQTKP